LQTLVQTPALHAAVAPGTLFGQTRPHMPQLLTLLSCVSQPFCAFASQLPQPLLQVGAQLPAAQLVVPCALVQAFAQRPQCATLLLSVTSQPLLAMLSQLPKPALQLAT
jgi:hypothetical protein